MSPRPCKVPGYESQELQQELLATDREITAWADKLGLPKTYTDEAAGWNNVLGGRHIIEVVRALIDENQKLVARIAEFEELKRRVDGMASMVYNKH